MSCSSSDHLVQVPLKVALLHVNLLIGLDHVLQLLLSLLPLLELRGDTGEIDGGESGTVFFSLFKLPHKDSWMEQGTKWLL